MGSLDICSIWRSSRRRISDLQALLAWRWGIPAFIHISDSKLHDVNVLGMLAVEAGASCEMDRGYVDFAPLSRVHRCFAQT